MQYAILDGEGHCINRILWDGEADWQPPAGCTAVYDPEGIHQSAVDPVEPVELARARDAEGQFIADDPTTPNVDEAWVKAID
jgi:hypothetical protein